VPFIDVNNCDFYYELSGIGPDIAFVHGECQGIEYLEYQIPEFSKRYRCLSYYRRAHGKTQAPLYGYSVENQTIDLKGLLDFAKMSRPVIVGIAMGNAMAVNYALNYPDRVRGLVLIAWSELIGWRRMLEEYDDNPSLAQSLEYMEILQTRGRQALIDFKDKDHSHRVVPTNPLIRRKYLEMYTNRPVEGYIKRLEIFTSVPDFIPQMQRIKIPILGICGTNDPYPDRPELLSNVPNFKQVWINNAERFVNWECPEEFNKALREFIEDLPQ
jgi:3-oxoadipate enol-lactonase